MRKRGRTNFTAYFAFWLRDSSRWIRYFGRRLRPPSQIRIHGISLPIPADLPEDRRRSILSERLERRAVLALVSKLEADDRVMEFGGGFGLLSSICAKHIGSNRVVSFEANVAQIPHIREVHKMNGVSPRVVGAAIGARDGVAQFWLTENVVSSSLNPWNGQGRPVEVQMLDVNRQIAEFKPTFLLVDIEGAEGEVFEVAKLDGVGKIIVELHRRKLGEGGVENVVARIERSGFRKIPWLSSNRKIFFERVEAS